MNAIVIEHVNVEELPAAWRAKLAAEPDASGTSRVTVRIEVETGSQEQAAIAATTGDPLFGMWRDREDMADVAGYVRALRAPRFTADGPPSGG
jgi:hypothetical protein